MVYDLVPFIHDVELKLALKDVLVSRSYDW